jgi:uncharacterized protein YjbI with pentapeptide repeats
MAPSHSPDPEDDTRRALRADCSSCFALCCTALGFRRSADFPVDKPAGTPCLNLVDDFSCTIHRTLRGRGFRGCTVFDCFGAGQRVSQRLFDGTSWRDAPETSAEMFSVFAVVRQLHEMLWYLAEAEARATAPDSVDEVTGLARRIDRLFDGTPTEVLAVDADGLRAEVRQTLMTISEEARAGYLAGHRDDTAGDLHPGADLVGRDLRARALCGADLRGALVIAADLRGRDLAGVDLLGADLRDARLEGADLTGALFLTQAQVNAARGDAHTTLPGHIARPGHW